MTELREVIKHEGDKWVIYSEDGKKLGEYGTEDEAKKRLAEIEYFKHQNEAASDLSVDEFYPLIERAVRRDGTIPVRIIAPGQGSSGYYPAEVLQRDGPKVFTKGTKCFWDHQTAQEEAQRPEGSLHNLAAVLETDARWQGEGKAGPGLYADLKVFDQFRKPVDEMAQHIGMSIRAMGKAKEGLAEGRKTKIIEEITAAKSVDFVTTPGAGGKILELFESARGTALERTETVDEKEAKELKEANTALASDKARLEGEIAAKDKVIADLKKTAMLGEAKVIVADAVAKSTLPDAAKARLSERLAVDPPAKDGALDKDALTQRISEAVKAEQDYLAQITGAGKIIGMGGSVPQTNQGSAALKESFKTMYLRQGKTEAEAETLATNAVRR